jgi:hypothetical protein
MIFLQSNYVEPRSCVLGSCINEKALVVISDWFYMCQKIAIVRRPYVLQMLYILRHYNSFICVLAYAIAFIGANSPTNLALKPGAFPVL